MSSSSIEHLSFSSHASRHGLIPPSPSSAPPPSSSQHIRCFPSPALHKSRKALVPPRSHSSHNGRERDREKHQLPAFNKDLYLIDNFRFEVSSSLSSHLREGDTLPQWEAVECVICDCESVPSCPICLSTPSCAQITRCGHLFCAACLYHYLSLSNRAWSRCALCFEPVYPHTIKSVRFNVRERVNVGDTVTFALMIRDKQDLRVQSAYVLPACENLDPLRFERFAVIDDISPIVHRELSELSQQFAESQSSGDTDLPYILMAQEAILLRLQLWTLAHPQHEARCKEIMKNSIRKAEMGLSATTPTSLFISQPAAVLDHSNNAEQPAPKNSVPTKTIKTLMPKKTVIEPVMVPSVARGTSSCGVADCVNSDQSVNVKAISVDLRSDLKSSHALTRFDPANSYIFYQAIDGQRIYLHNLSYRALMNTADNSITRLPAILMAKVSCLDHIFMNSAQRAAHRFLGHVPLSSRLSFALLDMTSCVPPFSIETRKAFDSVFRQEMTQRGRRAKKQKAITARNQHYAEQETTDMQHWLWQQQLEFEQEHDINTIDQFPSLLENSYPSVSSSRAADAQGTGPICLNSNSPPLASSPSLGKWNVIAAHGYAASSTWASLPSAATTVAASLPPVTSNTSPKRSRSMWSAKKHIVGLEAKV